MDMASLPGHSRLVLWAVCLLWLVLKYEVKTPFFKITVIE